MKISGKLFLISLNEYFNRPEFSVDVVIYLFLPFILFTIILYFYSNPRQSNKDPFEEIPSDEMELLKQISAQKGLSAFDRDFLIMQALNYYIKPAKILLDKQIFEQIENKLVIKAQKEGLSPDKDENVKNMRNLKKKLF